MAQSVFFDMELSQLHTIAEEKKAQSYRYVQTMCTKTEAGVDLMHTYLKDTKMENYQVRNLQPGDVVPSISDLFFSAFVFENEAHDLFGVNISNIAIDFGGNFYALAMKEPMTIISPEKKAAMEKAKKLEAAKAAKAAQEKAAADEDAELAAKLAAMDPEKAAKVRAAMEAKKAKAAKEAAAPSNEDAELEAKLAAMDPEKAAKVRAAMEAKKAKAAKEAAAAKDAELEAKLANMDPEKAAKVRAAMEAKAAKEAAAKEGAGE